MGVGYLACSVVVIFISGVWLLEEKWATKVLTYLAKVLCLCGLNGCDAFPHAPGIIAVKVILHTLSVDISELFLYLFFLLDLVTLQAVGISELCFVKGFHLFVHPCFSIWD